MFAKKTLLELLVKGLDAEEKSIPIYTKHLESALFWSGLDNKDIAEGKKLFKQLAAESAAHKEMVKQLIEYIEKSGKDAF